MSQLILDYAKEHPISVTAYIGVVLAMVGTMLNTGFANGLVLGGGLLLVVALVRGLHDGM
jgi:hypothetical protein